MTTGAVHTRSWRWTFDPWTLGSSQTSSNVPCGTRFASKSALGDNLTTTMAYMIHSYLLVDSRPRRICLVLPPALPIPLLSTVLDTLFNRFHAPTVSLASSSVMTAIAAGVRSATVVDIGWAGTTVSSVYEYREIRHTRSTRGGRCLVQEVHKRLKEKWDAGDAVDASVRYTLSFEECERVAIRSSWISPMHEPVESRHASLPTVQEDIEGHAGAEGSEGIEENNRDSEVRFKLTSSDGRQRAASVHIRDLADPCENAFIAPRFSRSSFDDEETPLPELIYRHLLSLPIDARATCMSRLIFTGGCAAIPGLKQRLYHELSLLVCQRGWDAVVGRAADVARAKAKANSVDDEHLPLPANQEIPASASPETSHDAVFGQARRRERNDSQRLRGELRVLDSLGPWTGASLAHQVKATAIATVDRELWLQQGIHGASRPNDVDSKAQQRQSLGSGVIRGASGTTSAWTLGAWGFP